MDLHSCKSQAGILGKHVFQAFETSARWQEYYHGGIFQPGLFFPHNIHCLLFFCLATTLISVKSLTKEALWKVVKHCKVSRQGKKSNLSRQ